MELPCPCVFLTHGFTSPIFGSGSAAAAAQAAFVAQAAAAATAAAMAEVIESFGNFLKFIVMNSRCFIRIIIYWNLFSIFVILFVNLEFLYSVVELVYQVHA